MATEVYRFEFERKVPLAEAEMSVHLALFAVEGLFGQARVRLDAGYHVDGPGSAIVVDATTEVGATVVRMFTAFLIREFGEHTFKVRRVESKRTSDPEDAACPAH